MRHESGIESLSSQLSLDSQIRSKVREIKQFDAILDEARQEFGNSRDLLDKASKAFDEARSLLAEAKRIEGPYARRTSEVDRRNKPRIQAANRVIRRVALERRMASELLCEFDEQSVINLRLAEAAERYVVARLGADRQDLKDEIDAAIKPLREARELVKLAGAKLDEARESYRERKIIYLEARTKRDEIEKRANGLRGELHALKKQLRLSTGTST